MANKKTPDSTPLAGSILSSQPTLMVAYHDGPGEIGFGGRHWQRGISQPVTAEEWAAMRARRDFNEFNFSEEQ